MALGRSRLITPAGESWDEWFDQPTPARISSLNVFRKSTRSGTTSDLMLKYLLDTDISIYVIKHKPPEVREQFRRHHGRMAISTVTLMELVFGAENSARVEHNLEVIEGFFLPDWKCLITTLPLPGTLPRSAPNFAAGERLSGPTIR